MKKCPFCGAEIEENARFCLYCMASLDEKELITKKKNKKRWLIIVAAVLVFALLITSIYLSVKSALPTFFEGISSSEGEKVSSSEKGENNSFSNDDYSRDEGSSPVNENDSSFGNEGGFSSDDNGSSSSDESGDNSSDVSSGGSNSPSSNESGSQSESSTPPISLPKYSYVAATVGNAYPTGYSAVYAPENAIVITKVNYKEESGNYVIPETIDGKKVAAIMPSAFSDSLVSSSVKSVTLPSTVKTIWSNAFKNCFNLTDLYIKSATIEIYKDAFPASANRNGKLTFHCKSDCRNFNHYFYRNIAGSYDANYVEWNG